MISDGPVQIVFIILNPFTRTTIKVTVRQESCSNTHSTSSNHLTAGKTNALFREPERVSYVPSAAPPGSPSARILDQNHLDLQTEKHTDHKEHFQHVFSLRQTRRTDKAAHNDSRFKILFITYTIIQNIISSEM